MKSNVRGVGYSVVKVFDLLLVVLDGVNFFTP